jgi:hypothetical protein
MIDKLKEANSIEEILDILKNSEDKEYDIMILLFRTANNGGTIYSPEIFSKSYSIDELVND